jgi:hypothetical protein
MTDLLSLVRKVVAGGDIEDPDVEVLRGLVCPDGVINSEGIEFLSVLRREARTVCASFEELFFAAVRQKVLADNCINAAEAGWLYRVLVARGFLGQAEKEFLLSLNREAKHVSPEFVRIYDECLKDYSAPLV